MAAAKAEVGSFSVERSTELSKQEHAMKTKTQVRAGEGGFIDPNGG
jgi:hypothetical protein